MTTGRINQGTRTATTYYAYAIISYEPCRERRIGSSPGSRGAAATATGVAGARGRRPIIVIYNIINSCAGARGDGRTRLEAGRASRAGARARGVCSRERFRPPA